MTIRLTVAGVAAAELDEVVQEMGDKPARMRVVVRVGSARGALTLAAFSLEEIRREWQRRRGC